MNPTKVKELLICKTSVHLSVPVGRQAGRQAGLKLLYCILRQCSSSWVHWSQSFSGQEPRKRQSGRGEEWEASCLACCLSALGKKVKLSLQTPLTLEQSGRIQTSAQNLSESVKMAPTTATVLGRGHLPWSGVSEEKLVCVVGNVGKCV